MHALKTAKCNQIPGTNEITTNTIKLISQEQINVLVDLYNTIYNTGIIPTEWLRATHRTITHNFLKNRTPNSEQSLVLGEQNVYGYHPIKV